MPLQIIRNDLTKMKVDAIVNATDELLSGSGGTDHAIHMAAGPKLKEACAAIGSLKAGEAVATEGYDLLCRYVIHTVGPVCEKEGHPSRSERNILRSCYESCLKEAASLDCGSVAFPLIASGTFGYPKANALEVATETITDFLSANDMDIYLVVFDRSAYEISSKLFANVQAYIDDNYVELAHLQNIYYGEAERPMSRPQMQAPAGLAHPPEEPKPKARKSTFFHRAEKSEMVFELDESFSEMLLRKIDEKGMTDVECYKRANIDKKLFSKIRSNSHYAPSKTTAFAFAIALKLSLPETEELLRKAGFSISHSQLLDVIVEYFIKKKNYDVYMINEVLFEYDQKLLGSK